MPIPIPPDQSSDFQRGAGHRCRSDEPRSTPRAARACSDRSSRRRTDAITQRTGRARMGDADRGSRCPDRTKSRMTRKGVSSARVADVATARHADQAMGSAVRSRQRADRRRPRDGPGLCLSLHRLPRGDRRRHPGHHAAIRSPGAPVCTGAGGPVSTCLGIGFFASHQVGDRPHSSHFRRPVRIWRRLSPSIASDRHDQPSMSWAIGGRPQGLSTLLRGLKQYDISITAIVTVADDGGSTGRIRSEFDMPAPGDIRSCLVALADDESLVGRPVPVPLRSRRVAARRPLLRQSLHHRPGSGDRQLRASGQRVGERAGHPRPRPCPRTIENVHPRRRAARRRGRSWGSRRSPHKEAPIKRVFSRARTPNRL